MTFNIYKSKIWIIIIIIILLNNLVLIFNFLALILEKRLVKFSKIKNLILNFLLFSFYLIKDFHLWFLRINTKLKALFLYLIISIAQFVVLISKFFSFLYANVILIVQRIFSEWVIVPIFKCIFVLFDLFIL